MKVLIYEDEWWPVYSIETDLESFGTEVEMPEKLFADYIKALSKFTTIQEKLRGIYKEVECQ